MSGLDDLEAQIASSPAARARLLADTLTILERQGIDTTKESFHGLVSADISNAPAFMGALAASTVVIVIGSAGQRPVAADLGTAASTVVIAIASAGQRPVGLGAFGGVESTGDQPTIAKLPSVENLSQIANALRQLADVVDAGQMEISQEVALAFKQIVERLGETAGGGDRSHN